MKTVYITHTSSPWNEPQDRIGVFTTNDKAIKAIQRKFKLSEYDLKSLNKINQTQGRQINFEIEPVDLNIIEI